MSHKYDMPKDKTNPLIYFPIAVISVVIVGWVFGSGFYYGIRTADEHPLDDPVTNEDEASQVINVQALAEPTAELIAQGKTHYETLCVSCHGTSGVGDGPSGINLNPAPRNFKIMDGWKNGASVAGMWDTLQNGIAGGSMASYQLTPPDQRIAMIHYIRDEWVPNPPEITEDDIAALPGPSASGGTVDMSAIQTDAPAISLVKDKLEASIVQVKQPAEKVSVPDTIMQLSGKSIYDDNCSTCHGDMGQGKKNSKILTTYPYRRMSTRPLIGSRAAWVDDEGVFTDIVTQSSSGENIHGFATFTKDQVRDLHQFVSELAKSGAEI